MNPNEMTEKEQIKYVQKFYQNIGYIYNPSEQVKLEAVKTNLFAIEYMHKPPENVQLYVVKKHGLYIKLIINNLGKNPSKKIQKAAIINDYRSIKFIINSSLKLQKCSVKINLKAIYYIKKPKYKKLMKWID